jgi:hypothetical protein
MQSWDQTSQKPAMSITLQMYRNMCRLRGFLSFFVTSAEFSLLKASVNYLTSTVVAARICCSPLASLWTGCLYSKQASSKFASKTHQYIMHDPWVFFLSLVFSDYDYKSRWSQATVNWIFIHFFQFWSCRWASSRLFLQVHYFSTHLLCHSCCKSFLGCSFLQVFLHSSLPWSPERRNLVLCQRTVAPLRHCNAWENAEK